MCKVLSINLRKSVQIPIFINPQHLYYLHLCLVSNQSSPLCSGSARFLYQFGFWVCFCLLCNVLNVSRNVTNKHYKFRIF